MLMIMLRASVLFCCGFVSLTASAGNTAPTNVFGYIPADTVNFAPTKTANHAPMSAPKFVPHGVSSVSSKTLNFAPSTTIPNPAPVSAPKFVSHNVSYAPDNSVLSFAATKTVPSKAATPTTYHVSYAPSAKTILTPAPTNVIHREPATIKVAPPVSNDNNVTPSVGVWLLIDTKAHRIEVKQGEKTLETITGIAIGRKGAGLKHHRGDDITPYGNYRIGWVGERSNFHKFFGLNYPSVQDAEIGLKRGIISERNYSDIVTAHNLNTVPPQDTPLGGKIGIHGIGAGDATVHQLFDWTHGCIALTNQQIDHLSQWIDTGTVVKIR